jgi:hypothetical protein
MIEVKVTKILEDWWISEEDAKELTDEEIVELIQEDISSFMENVDWKINRRLDRTSDGR